MAESILQVVQEHARNIPDKTAIIDNNGSRISYRDLWDSICRMSCWLKQLGLQEGDRVVAKASHTVQYVICEYGTHLAGGIFMPVEKTLSPDAMREMLKIVGGRFLISDEPVGAQEVFLECALKELPPIPAPQAEIAFPSPDATANIIYTTGTTGKPKGVCLSHKYFLAVSRNHLEITQINQQDVQLIMGMLHHINAILRINLCLVMGATAVLQEGLLSVAGFFDNLEKYRITCMYLFPSALKMIFRLSGDHLGEFADQLSYIETGSAPVGEQEKERLRRLLPKTRLCISYGCTEAGAFAGFDWSRYPNRPNCIGRPVNGTKIIIVDENNQEISSSKENCGRIACIGPTLMKGYWEAPELTRSVLDGDRFYTSDVGYIDPEGFVYLMGRANDIINVGGIKVSPTELEDKVLELEGVADSACIPVEDPIVGQVPKLFVVVKEGRPFDAKEIRDFLANCLEPFKLPKYIVRIDKIPRNFNGKIQKQLLQ